MKLSIKVTSDDLIRALRWDSSNFADLLKQRRRSTRGKPVVINPQLRKRARARRKAFMHGEPL
jgi:hypothetical protein